MYEKTKSMKDYIVILFGEFKNSRTVYEVMTSITPVVESENLKFNYNDLSIICHFQSENSQKEIHEFIQSGIQYDMVNMFFVSEEKNMSYFMDDNMKKHLMDLSESESPNMVIDMDKIRNGEDGLLEQDLMVNLPIVFDDDEDEEDEIKLLKSKTKEPSLDQILEKIHIYGYDSLSKKELQILNTFSN